MKKLTKEESEFYRKFHIPGCGNLNSVKLNAVFLRKNNTYEHELKKFEVAWDLLQTGCNFIVEAERSRKRGMPRKIVDVVDLTSGTEIEIVHKHESDQEILDYRWAGVMVILVDGVVCPSCGKSYPRRNKKGICQFCKKKGGKI